MHGKPRLTQRLNQRIYFEGLKSKASAGAPAYNGGLRAEPSAGLGGHKAKPP